MMDPRNLKKWLIIIAVLYLVFPQDLIPDFLGSGLGLIDDLSLIALLTSFCAETRPTITRPFGSSSSEYHQSFLGRQRCRPSWVRRSPSRSTRCRALVIALLMVVLRVFLHGLAKVTLAKGDDLR